MTAAKEFAKLKAVMLRPSDDEDRWLGAASEATRHLVENASANDVLLYASMSPMMAIGASRTPARNRPRQRPVA